MKSVGEAMAIGRTFGQAFAKALRSRELDKPPCLEEVSEQELLDSLRAARPGPLRDGARAVRPRPRDRADPRAHAHRPVVPARAARARARPAGAVRGRARVSLGGHLRGGVPGAHALLLLRLGAQGPGRGAPRRARVGRDPRLRPQPHRPGHRVRLLLRARRDDRARVRSRRGDGQLQPRDRLDRLRHLRSPVLRAADARGRAWPWSRSSSRSA